MVTEVLAGVTGGLSLASGVMSGVSAEQQARAREKALSERMQQEQVAANQNTINNMDQVNRMMSKQTAIAAAGGGRIDSGPSSFTSIQTDTLNEFAKDENANQLNLSFQQESDRAGIQSAKEAGIQSMAGGIVSGIAGAASAAANLYVPKATGSASTDLKAANPVLDNIEQSERQQMSALQLPHFDLPVE